MAQITCSKSGVIFRCEHLPMSLATSANITHPMFSIPQHRLISLAGQWAAGKLSPVESYLLYLALLDSTELIQWRTHAQFTANTPAIVANNMHSLLGIISKINVIKHPHFTLPSFAIGADTNTLDNSYHWIQAWITNYKNWYESYLDSRRQDEIKERLSTREESLQRLIKSAVPTESYAKTLADWAATAGSFPESLTIHPISKASISISDYWKQIIHTIANDDKLWRYPRKDIVELIEHCEENITHGNIYAHTLMKYLRKGLHKYDDYLGFADLVDDAEPRTTGFTVMSSNASVHAINLAALITTAPTEEPKKHQYPTNIAWLKAYTKWKLAQQRGNKTS